MSYYMSELLTKKGKKLVVVLKLFKKMNNQISKDNWLYAILINNCLYVTTSSCEMIE